MKKKVKKNSKGAPKKIVTPKKKKRVNFSLFYSFIALAISAFLYLGLSNFLSVFFGFVMIVSGAVFLLFLIIRITYFFLEKSTK